ncbi:MAG TPA: hypothetical protein VHC20_00780 [Candidatus Paceibacterota bacterium]|nr:hypothetical protein [Candidatus Paceibacterota bacterium]
MSQIRPPNPEIATSPPLPVGPASQSAQPAPDWSVWRAFYGSLRYYSRKSPDLVKELLTGNIGLGDAQAALLLSMGEQYLNDMDRLDANARAELTRRYPARDVIPQEALRNVHRLKVRQGLGAPPPESIPQTPQGLYLQQQMAVDGLDKQFDAEKMQALAHHQQQLMQAMGTERFAALDTWIRQNVAGSVKVFKYATPVPMPEQFKASAATER